MYNFATLIIEHKAMKVVTKVSELRSALDELAGRSLGFVPTMGALHEGHLSLVARARKECAACVVSVFVNPTQFNDKTDLKNYPRTPEADAALLEKAGADVDRFLKILEDNNILDDGVKRGRSVACMSKEFFDKLWPAGGPSKQRDGGEGGA